MSELLQGWLERLGYASEPDRVHTIDGSIRPAHPYLREIRTLLHPDGDIRAKAIFDVEGVPSVAFLATNDSQPLTEEALNEIRQKVWNQNLINVLIDVSTST